MTTVGFIGLGIMGGPMAANLVKAGFDVVGYNRSPEKTAKLVAQGGRAAASVAEAGQRPGGPALPRHEHHPPGHGQGRR